jgi:hypothetical protein
MGRIGFVRSRRPGSCDAACANRRETTFFGEADYRLSHDLLGKGSGQGPSGGLGLLVGAQPHPRDWHFR